MARAARAAERFAAIPALGSLALFLVKFAPGSLASNATCAGFVPRKY